MNKFQWNIFRQLQIVSKQIKILFVEQLAIFPRKKYPLK